MYCFFVKVITARNTIEADAGFDSLGRIKTTGVIMDGKKPIYSRFGYLTKANGESTLLLNSESIYYNNVVNNRTYDFEKKDGAIISPRIAKISDSTFGNITYKYDSFGQLVEENNAGIKIEYIYNSGGNIEMIKRNDSAYRTIQYDKDKVTKINNQEIRYYGQYLRSYKDNYSVFWTGNKLTEYGEYRLEYDDNGKLIEIYETFSDGDYDGENLSTRIIYVGNRISEVQRYGCNIKYFYNQLGNLIGLQWNGNYYFYVRDALQNILGIVDSTGKLVVKYSYTAFGECISITGELKDTLGKYNSFRYKGYYYVEETGFYWLSSRYYDPEIGRFISPDSVDYLDPTTINGLNLYAYCYNNPIMYADPSGHMPEWAKWAIGAGVILLLGAAAIFATGALGVVAGAAFYGAVTSAVSGALFSGVSEGISTAINGEGFWKGFSHGAASGFMFGAIIGGAAGAAVSSLNFALGGVKIVGSAQRTGSLFHQFASNVQAGKMSLAVGRYSEIHLNKSKGLGIRGFRPDVTGVLKNGNLRVVEVVSSSQTYASQLDKVGRMLDMYSHISSGLTINPIQFILNWFVF